MRIALFCFGFIVLSITGKAQITEDFSDGDFCSDPEWAGCESFFRVNDDLQLQSDAEGADTAYLVTEMAGFEAEEWRFWVKLGFSPSANNYARFYLFCDSDRPDESLNGVFIQLGEAGSGDAVKLYRKKGTNLSLICSGTEGLISSSFSLFIKVKRYPGHWEVFVSEDGSLFYKDSEADDEDDDPYGYLGLYCQFTKSNSKKFYFDDIYCGHSLIDSIAPACTHISVIDSSVICCSFSEALMGESTLNTDNYCINSQIIPQSVSFENTKPDEIMIFLCNPLVKDSQYNIVFKNICDHEGNTVDSSRIYTFDYHPEQAFDIVITEIMADPLPAVKDYSSEYFEIFNRTDYHIDLFGWSLEYGAHFKSLEKYTIAPHAYLVITGPTFPEEGYQCISLLTGESSLNNTSGQIIIRNKEGKYIHGVAYSSDWYQSPYKAEGGWSLEMMDTQNPCGCENNWKESEADYGGTPGRTNSVKCDNPDIYAPHLIYAYPIHPLLLYVKFNEQVDSNMLINPGNYFIEPEIGNPAMVAIEDHNFNSVSLLLNRALVENTVYSIKCSSDITDCTGNHLLEDNSIIFSLPEKIKKEAVCISEILPVPQTGGEDFFEIYNNSSLAYDLKTLGIGLIDTLSWEVTDVKPLSESGRLILPCDYYVFCKHKENICDYYYTPFPDHIIEISSIPSFTNDKACPALVRISDNQVIDWMCYEESMHHPFLSDTRGVSFEIINYGISAYRRDNWHSASEHSGFATPTAINSQCICNPGNDAIMQIHPLSFSPDNDGFEDILEISIETNKAAYVLNLRIFNEAGVLVRHLVNNYSISSHSSFYWDGLSDEGICVNYGIYILLAELINPHGNFSSFKKACIVEPY